MKSVLNSVTLKTHLPEADSYKNAQANIKTIAIEFSIFDLIKPDYFRGVFEELLQKNFTSTLYT